jgi:hypothetical protein
MGLSHSRAAGEDGFTVVDLETTGLPPAKDWVIELGLSPDVAERAQRDYLRQVVAAAWRDLRVTDLERAGLLEVAAPPGVPAGEALAILEGQHPAEDLTASSLVVGSVNSPGVAATERCSLPALLGDAAGGTGAGFGGFVGGCWCAGGMPRRRDPSSVKVVYRTARAGLRVTRGQRRRLIGLLVSAGDVWACVLELNTWRRARQDRPLASYRELCRLLAASGPGTFGELDSVGARSVLRRYADAWFAAAKRRREGDVSARFPRRRRRMVPLRWYHGTFRLDGRVLAIPVARGCPPLRVRLDRDLPYPAGQVRQAGRRAGHVLDLPQVLQTCPQASGAGVQLPALPVPRPPRPDRGDPHRRLRAERPLCPLSGDRHRHGR